MKGWLCNWQVSWGQIIYSNFAFCLPIYRPNLRVCRRCIYKEELHWPVFRRRVRNYVSFQGAFCWPHLSIFYFLVQCGLGHEVRRGKGLPAVWGLFLNSPVQYEMHRVWGGGANQGQGKPAPAQLLHQPRSQIPCNRTKAGMYQNPKKGNGILFEMCWNRGACVFLSAWEAVTVSSKTCTLSWLGYLKLYLSATYIRQTATWLVCLQGNEHQIMFLPVLSLQRLQEEITKMSTSLERNALYIKSVSFSIPCNFLLTFERSGLV